MLNQRYQKNIPRLECGCNDLGSENMSCSSAGVCTCTQNVTGNKCDICKPGYFPFPDCKIGKIYNSTSISNAQTKMPRSLFYI